MPGILEPFSEILEGSVRLSSDDYTDSLASAGNLFLLATDRRTFLGSEEAGNRCQGFRDAQHRTPALP